MRAGRLLFAGIFLAFSLVPWASAQRRDIEVGSAPRFWGLTLNTNSWAVVIGINRYQHPRIPPLRYARKDAEESSLRVLGRYEEDSNR